MTMVYMQTIPAITGRLATYFTYTALIKDHLLVFFNGQTIATDHILEFAIFLVCFSPLLFCNKLSSSQCSSFWS